MAHVRYDKILTHSHTTSGLSCHFSIYIYIYIYIFFFFGGGGGLSLFWELRDNRVFKKISHFDSTSKPRNHLNFAIHCW